MNSPRRPLKVGIQLPEVEREVRWPEYVAMARLAEDVGFDSIWLGDHLLYRASTIGSRGPWEVWTMLAAIAASTTRVELGPLVACTAFHNPAMLAKMAATVDEISGGRLIVGLGAGWNDAEFEAFGFPVDRRVSRFEEAFTIIRLLLQTGHADFEGTFYSARDGELLPRPRPGGPPLMVGSRGERMLAITLPYVQAWNAWYFDTDNQPGGVPELRGLVDRAAIAAGRLPEDIERSVAVFVGMPGGVGRPRADPDAPVVKPLEGPPDVVAEGLRSYAREGISLVQLVVDPITSASIEGLAPVLAELDRG